MKSNVYTNKLLAASEFFMSFRYTLNLVKLRNIEIISDFLVQSCLTLQIRRTMTRTPLMM